MYSCRCAIRNRRQKKDQGEIQFFCRFPDRNDFSVGYSCRLAHRKYQLASGLWNVNCDVDPSGKTINHRQKKCVPRPKKKKKRKEYNTHANLDKYMNINLNSNIKIQAFKAYMNSPSKFSTNKFIQIRVSNTCTMCSVTQGSSMCSVTIVFIKYMYKEIVFQQQSKFCGASTLAMKPKRF